MKKIGIVIFTVLFLAACSTPQVVEEKKVTDTKLSCSELRGEISKAEEFEKNARSKKGATGTNVAAALFFWPAMIATYKNADDAIAAAKARKNHLMAIYTKKAC